MAKFKISKEFKIGFFAILMLAFLYWGINFLKGMDIFAGTKTYYAVYDRVNGLEGSANIFVNGYKVGAVSDMIYNPAVSDKIVLELGIKSKYRIPVNSTARIFSQGIMSGKAVELALGYSPEYLNEGDTLFSSQGKDIMDIAGGELEFIKERFNDVVNSVVTTLNSLNSILENNNGNITATLSNMASLTGNLNTALNSEDGSLKNIIADLNALSATLKSKTTQIDNIVNNAERFTDSLAQAQIPSLVADMSNTLQSLNQTLEKINSGDGTVGNLVNDRALYDSLVVAVSNISYLMEDLQANPKRYVHFSLFGGGKKDK